jgi:FkbM family methyltransferase
MMLQRIKNAMESVFRFTGQEIVRYTPGYEKALFPLVGNELSPLQFAIPSIMVDRGDFFFIQIGANDGIRADSLRSLILRYHLRGLLVEPLCDMFEKLKINYSSETQLTFENVAIAEKDGEASLFRFRLDAPVPDWIHGMATFNGQKIINLAKNWKLDQYVEEVRVKSVTFEKLLNVHRVETITLLQIDTEGFDLQVIKMALKSGVLPTLINYEFVNLSLMDRLESCRLLSEYGYSFLHGRIDTLAVRDVKD